MQITHRHSHHVTHHIHDALHVLTSFTKKNAVMCIALFAALITSIIVPIDRTYLDILISKP